MKLFVQATAFVLALIGIALLRWPRRDVEGVFLMLKWREIFGFGMLGVAALLFWWSQSI
jgi:hypothetical protein